MRCFVTGATGFLGAAVTRQLVELSVPTAVLVRANSSTDRIADVLDRLHVCRGDIHDLGSIESAIEQFRPDTILHLGWAGVDAKDRDSVIQIRNHTATLELLQAASRYGVKTIVGVGSQAECGPKQNVVPESALCEPVTLYGAAKLATAILGKSLSQSLGIRFVWLRLFSCYGPGDHATFLIPSLIESLLARQRPSLTAAVQRWDYLYVEDAARAVIHAAKSETMSGIYNLGSGTAVVLRDVIEMIRDTIDPSLELGFGGIAYGPNAVMHLQADTTRLTSTGWSPTTSLEDGINKTVSWHKKRATP